MQVIKTIIIFSLITFLVLVIIIFLRAMFEKLLDED